MHCLLDFKGKNEEGRIHLPQHLHGMTPNFVSSLSPLHFPLPRHSNSSLFPLHSSLSIPSSLSIAPALEFFTLPSSLFTFHCPGTRILHSSLFTLHFPLLRHSNSSLFPLHSSLKNYFLIFTVLPPALTIATTATLALTSSTFELAVTDATRMPSTE